MKKLLFSGLIFCGILLFAAQTKGQTFANNGAPVIQTPADNHGLLAYRDNTVVVFQWGNDDEKYIDRYVIEHSTDNIHFNPLHEVTARGDISPNNLYRDMDSYPASSVNFYRLRTVLSDGSSVYSASVRVNVDIRRTPLLRPTVLHIGTTLWMDNYHAQPLIVNFFSGNGTLMGSFQTNNTSLNIPTSGWGKGIIYYRISDATHALIDAGKIMIL